VIRNGEDTERFLGRCDMRVYLNTIKTIKFFQLAGVTRGDSLKEIEEKTERMSKEEALKLIRKVKSNRIDLWEKIGVK